MADDNRNQAGSGGSDGTGNTGVIENLTIEQVPDSVKQILIDKGVDIGFGRAKEKHEKDLPNTIESTLKKELGISLKDKDAIKSLISKKDHISRLIEEAGTEDFDEIISRASKATVDKLTDVDRLNQELTKHKTTLSSKEREFASLSESIKQKDEQYTKRESLLLSKINNLVVTDKLRLLAVENSVYDPEDVIERLGKLVKVKEDEDGSFTPVVMNAKGDIRYNDKGELFSLDAFVKEFLAERPHLKKAEVKPGTGTGRKRAEGGAGGAGGALTMEDLKNPATFVKNYKDVIDGVKSGKIKIS